MATPPSLHRLTIDQLRSFVVLAEELNFSRAADRLHVARSPFSRRIRDLEEVVGAPLFIRTTRSVELTPVGVRLLPRARAAVHDLAALLRDIHEEVGGAGRSFNVGIPPGGISARERGELHAAIRTVAAQGSIHVEPTHPADLPWRLASGELDLGVVSALGDAGTLDGVVIDEGHFSLALPAHDPAAAADRVHLSSLTHLRYAEIEVDPPTANSLELRRRVMASRVASAVIRVKDTELLAEVVAGGECFTIVTSDGSSSTRALEDPGIALRPIAGFDYVRVRLVVWLADRLEADPTLAALVARLRARYPSPR